MQSFSLKGRGAANLTNLFFSVTNKKNKNKTDVKGAQVKQKPDIVTVARYFRRYDDMLDATSSAGGLTVICVIDYSVGTLTVYPAFCSINDNFDKTTGMSQATARQLRNEGIVMQYSRVGTLYDTLRNALLSNRYTFTSLDDNANRKIKVGFDMCMTTYSNVGAIF